MRLLQQLSLAALRARPAAASVRPPFAMAASSSSWEAFASPAGAESVRPFHLALPVHDLDQAKAFYGG